MFDIQPEQQQAAHDSHCFDTDTLTSLEATQRKVRAIIEACEGAVKLEIENSDLSEDGKASAVSGLDSLDDVLENTLYSTDQEISALKIEIADAE